LGFGASTAEVVDASVLLGLRARFHEVGMAMAASKPMMATTIMISTSVKPDLRFDLMS